MAHPLPGLRRSLGAWTAPGFGPRYITSFSRGGEEFETPLLTAPAEKASCDRELPPNRGAASTCLFGLFIFIRRWKRSSRRAFLRIFVWSLSFSGPSISVENWTRFDWEVYWSEIVARLLAPALLLHFALVFPGRSDTTIRSSSKTAGGLLFSLSLCF